MDQATINQIFQEELQKAGMTGESWLESPTATNPEPQVHLRVGDVHHVLNIADLTSLSGTPDEQFRTAIQRIVYPTPVYPPPERPI